MAIGATDFFAFPLYDTGSAAWGAGINGVLIDIDRLLQEARDLLIWDENTAGRIDGSEVLTFDGEVLGWA